MQLPLQEFMNTFLDLNHDLVSVQNMPLRDHIFQCDISIDVLAVAFRDTNNNFHEAQSGSFRKAGEFLMELARFIPTSISINKPTHQRDLFKYGQIVYRQPLSPPSTYCGFKLKEEPNETKGNIELMKLVEHFLSRK